MLTACLSLAPLRSAAVCIAAAPVGGPLTCPCESL